MPLNERLDQRRGGRHEVVGRWSILLSLWAVALSWTSVASAQVDVAIIDLALEDEAPSEASRAVEESLAAGLRPTASRVFFLDEVLNGVSSGSAPAECAEETCGLEAAQRLGAQAAVRGRFSQLGQLYEVEAELVLARDGTRLGGTTLSCEACTFTEALDTVRRAGQGLQPAMPGLVALTLTPPEASATIDDEPVQAGSTLALAAGTHTIVVEADGATPLSRQITVVAGASSEVVLSLSTSLPPTESGTDRPEPRPRSRLSRSPQLWGWLSFGAALGALVPGVLWLGLEGQCAIGSDDWNGICVDVYSTWPQGLALTLVGTGFLAAAVALLIVHSRNRRRAAPVEP